MDGIALASYLAAKWAKVLARAGIAADYVIGRVQAFFDADPALDAAWAEPLADYVVLDLALAAFATDIDVSIRGNSYRLSQRKELATLYVAARQRVAWLLALPGEDTVGTVVTVTADWQTGPERVEAW